MKNINHLRIVLASPGDVQSEREEMPRLVDKVNQMFRTLKFEYHLELWRWETDSHPGFHALGPQDLIDDALHIDTCDLLVGVFWRRLGTPVSDARSCKEHEIRKGIAAWKKNGTPQVMLYFKQSPVDPRGDEESKQMERLVAFKKELLEAEKPLIWSYSDIVQFQDQVVNHLLMHVGEIAQRASTGNHSSVRFSVYAEPVLIRSKGKTELLGDILLKCLCSP